MVLAQPRGTSFCEHIQKRVESGHRATYEVDTVLTDGSVLTTTHELAAVGSLGVAAGRAAFMALPARMPNLRFIGLGVTEAGIAQRAVDAGSCRVPARLLPSTTRHQTDPPVSISIINTDNLPFNGDAVKSHVLACDYTQNLVDAEPFERWLNARVCFHNSMVDRHHVSSGGTPTSHAPSQRQTGARDRGRIAHALLPVSLAAVPGVLLRTSAGELSTDIQLKLRVANGLHTAMVYAMALSGERATDACADACSPILAYLEQLFERDIVHMTWRSRMPASHRPSSLHGVDAAAPAPPLWAEHLLCRPERDAKAQAAPAAVGARGGPRGGEWWRMEGPRTWRRLRSRRCCASSPNRRSPAAHRRARQARLCRPSRRLRPWPRPAAARPTPTPTPNANANANADKSGCCGGGGTGRGQGESVEENGGRYAYASGLHVDTIAGTYEFADGNGLVPLLLRPLGRPGGSSALAVRSLVTQVLSAIDSAFGTPSLAPLMERVSPLPHARRGRACMEVLRSLDVHRRLELPTGSMLAEAVAQEVEAAEAVDVHAHCFAAEYGEKLVAFGVDKLLTAGYGDPDLACSPDLVAQYLAVADDSPGGVCSAAAGHTGGARLAHPLCRRSPISEACLGVVSTLEALGLGEALEKLRLGRHTPLVRDAGRRQVQREGARNCQAPLRHLVALALFSPSSSARACSRRHSTLQAGARGGLSARRRLGARRGDTGRSQEPRTLRGVANLLERCVTASAPSMSPRRPRHTFAYEPPPPQPAPRRVAWPVTVSWGDGMDDHDDVVVDGVEKPCTPREGPGDAAPPGGEGGGGGGGWDNGQSNKRRAVLVSHGGAQRASTFDEPEDGFDTRGACNASPRPPPPASRPAWWGMRPPPRVMVGEARRH